MAPSGRELWKGTDGDTWPVGTWTANTDFPGQLGTGTADINTNRGRVLLSAGAGTHASMSFLLRPPSANVDVTVAYDHASTDASYALVSVRSALPLMGSGGQPDNNYYFNHLGSSGAWEVGKTVAGSGSSLTTGTTAITPGTPQYVRIQVVGPHLRVKMWLSTANQPVAWTYETVDWSITQAGYVGLGAGYIASATKYFTDFTYTDLTPAPPLLLARLQRRKRKPIKPPHVVVSWSGQGELLTDGTFAGASTVGHKSAGTLATDGTFTGAGKITHKAAGTLSTGGTFTGAGVITHKSAGTLTTNGTFTGAGKITHKSAGTLATDGSFSTATGKVTHKTAGTFATDGSFSSATGLISHKTAGTFQTDGTFTGAGVGGAGTPPVTTPEEPQHGGLGRRGPYTPVEQMRHKQLLVREDEELMVLM